MVLKRWKMLPVFCPSQPPHPTKTHTHMHEQRIQRQCAKKWSSSSALAKQKLRPKQRTHTHTQILICFMLACSLPRASLSSPTAFQSVALLLLLLLLSSWHNCNKFVLYCIRSAAPTRLRNSAKEVVAKKIYMYTPSKQAEGSRGRGGNNNEQKGHKIEKGTQWVSEWVNTQNEGDYGILFRANFDLY